MLLLVLWTFIVQYGLPVRWLSAIRPAAAAEVDWGSVDEPGEDQGADQGDDQAAEDQGPAEENYQEEEPPAEEQDDSAREEPPAEDEGGRDLFEEEEPPARAERPAARQEEEEPVVQERPARRGGDVPRRAVATPGGELLLVTLAAAAPSNTEAALVEQAAARWLADEGGFTLSDLLAALGGQQPQEDAAALAAKADGLLEEGKRAYDAVEIDEAVVKLEEACNLYRQLLDRPANKTKLLEALSYLAATQTLDGDIEGAQRNFQMALAVDSSYDYNALNIPGPGVDKVFQTAKDDLTNAASGSLALVSNIDGVRVYLNGTMRGVAPLSLDNLVIGNYHLTARALGYQDFRTKVEVYEEKKEINLELSPAPRQPQYARLVEGINRDFEHDFVWPDAQKLGELVRASQLLLLQVDRTANGYRLKALYYQLDRESYKTYTASLSGSPARLTDEVAQALAELFSDDVETLPAIAPVATHHGGGRVAADGEGERGEDEEDGTEWYASWWFWTIIGLVAAGGGTAAGVCLTTDMCGGGGGGGGGGNGNSVKIVF